MQVFLKIPYEFIDVAVRSAKQRHAKWLEEVSKLLHIGIKQKLLE
jgi:hypothetical protein